VIICSKECIILQKTYGIINTYGEYKRCVHTHIVKVVNGKRTPSNPNEVTKSHNVRFQNINVIKLEVYNICAP
jgi:hypothetical protein